MNDRDRVERELKFSCSDLNTLRERLQDAEAERQSASLFEDNMIYDRRGELAEGGRLLRLRLVGKSACLTYKGPASFDGGLKIREERETEIANAEELRAILDHLGYTRTQRYQKYREEWRLGGVTICLDRTPIGEFVEFEGSAAAALARRLGLDPDAAERRSYLKIYEDYRQTHPQAPKDMVFT
ncbi:MAG: class IV adenylate cyclase [Acidobacteriota bacterium]|nr:class IV adenylate cyclase [Acidobacteriota bacterium]